MIKNIKLATLLFILVLFLSSCNIVVERIWYDTANDAIQQGLLDQDSHELQRLSIDNEIIVLYKLNDADAVGVGSVTASDKGYSWYQGMSPFHGKFMQFDYQTESRYVIPLTIGKTSDEKIKEIILEGKQNKYKLKVVNGYYIGANIELFYEAKLLK
ncbi:hypothetical protein [Paenibacillus sp. 1001270B_150601_E10]|uniref:hypothetical protein n=1 Tax=Paenibacillus sp. 1001270B_150601_E10 TaxID=2787079 RepID=UPI00189ED448|nr:hypothetical protein [Paenibacillus sp. 1001270B_150601_E10]